MNIGLNEMKRLTTLIFGMILCLMVPVPASAQDDGSDPNVPPPVDPNLITTDSTTTSTITTTGKTTTTLKSPPASAISPTINTSNSDLCTFGVAGAVQTQILGVSMGTQITDFNCEKLKNAKTLYDMGMKVAAVSVMCQDERIFDAMWNAGTPCPFEGLIGAEAKAAWEVHFASNPEDEKKTVEQEDEGYTKNEQTLFAGGAIGSLLLLLLLL